MYKYERQCTRAQNVNKAQHACIISNINIASLATEMQQSVPFAMLRDMHCCQQYRHPNCCHGKAI